MFDIEEEAKVDKEGSVGALIGSIIIILVLILGGWYVWEEAKRIKNIPPIETERTIVEKETEQLETQFESDILVDIESDMEQLDQELE